MIELETDRLLLRSMVSDDLDWFAALRGNAEVMQYIGGGSAMTRDQAIARLTRYLACWSEHGLGMFAVQTRESPEPIGWGGLQPLDGGTEIEVGYAFGRQAWGRGFATETARAVVRWGFSERKLERIVAVAYPENEASRRVMEKLGMRYEGLRFVYGVDSVYYSLTADDFASSTTLRSRGG